MFCKYCGIEIKGQAFFCPQCGARLEQQEKKEGQPVKERKLSGKTAVFGIAAVAVIIMAGAAFGISMLRGNPSGQAEEAGQGPQEPLNNIEDAALHKEGGDEYPVVLHAYSAVDVITEGDSTVTGDMLQNVSALVREGEGNQTGEVILTADTKSGELSMNLPSGVYTVQLHADGYLDIYVKIEVAEESAAKDVYVMPQLNEGQTGVVLTWEGEEADLDLTLFTPYQAENGDMAHIGGSVKEDGRGNVLVSDNKGRCEAMYVNSGETGSYKLYVNDYTDSVAGNYTADTLDRINVHIYIYNSAGFVAEYTMPLGQDGVVWEVLELNGNTITPAQRVYSEVSGKNWWMEDKEAAQLVKDKNRAARQAFYDVMVNGAMPGGHYDETSLGILREIAAGTDPNNNGFLFLLKDIDGDGVEELLVLDAQEELELKDVDDYDGYDGIIKTSFVLKYTEVGVEVIFQDTMEYTMGEFLLNNNKVIEIHRISTYNSNWTPEGSSYKNIENEVYLLGRSYTVCDDWSIFSNWQEDKGKKEYSFVEYTDTGENAGLGTEYYIDEQPVSREEWREGIQTDIINNLIPDEQMFEANLESLQKMLLN